MLPEYIFSGAKIDFGINRLLLELILTIKNSETSGTVLLPFMRLYFQRISFLLFRMFGIYVYDVCLEFTYITYCCNAGSMKSNMKSSIFITKYLNILKRKTIC